MIILKGDQADFTDRNSRGELVHDEPYLPRYSQQGYEFDDNQSMVQTDDSHLRRKVKFFISFRLLILYLALLPIHAPFVSSRDRTTEAPYNPLHSTVSSSTRLPSSENPFAHPDDSRHSLLLGPVPDALANRKAKRRFFIALAWALSVYVAIGAILGPILEHYLNDKDPNVQNESDSNYALPYGLSANRSSVSSKLALQGSSELVLLPASGKIDIQLPNSVSGNVKIERSPTNETDKDGNETDVSKKTSFWAQFTLPQSVDAVMSKHSESLINHLLVPLQPLQLVLPLQQSPSDSNSTITSNDKNSTDSDNDDNDDDDKGNKDSNSSSKRRRSFDDYYDAKPVKLYNNNPSKWHRALCPLISTFGGVIPSWYPFNCMGPHNMRAQVWTSYENAWKQQQDKLKSEFQSKQKDLNIASTIPSINNKRRALASDQLNTTTKNQSNKDDDIGQIEFSPGENQPSEWASLVVESLNQNQTGGLNITVDDPYSNGTSAVDIIPACNDCLADATITLYLPADLPALDLSVSTSSKDMGVFISDLSEVMLDTVNIDLVSGNIAIDVSNI